MTDNPGYTSTEPNSDVLLTENGVAVVFTDDGSIGRIIEEEELNTILREIDA